MATLPPGSPDSGSAKLRKATGEGAHAATGNHLNYCQVPLLGRDMSVWQQKLDGGVAEDLVLLCSLGRLSPWMPEVLDGISFSSWCSDKEDNFGGKCRLTFHLTNTE